MSPFLALFLPRVLWKSELSVGFILDFNGVYEFTTHKVESDKAQMLQENF